MEKDDIGFEVKRLDNEIHSYVALTRAAMGAGELTMMHSWIIGYLYANREREIFQKDLEKRFNIRRSTATVMLQNLEQKGYIVREAVHSDARMKRIVLTQKAIRHNLAIRDQIDAFNKELEEGLTSEEKKMFLRILDKIKKNLE